MRHARHLATILLLVLLTACGSEPFAAPPHDADGGITAAAVYAHGPASGVAFLPPVGPDVDTRDFFPGASIEIEVRAQPSGELLQSYSSADGSVRVEDDFYMALWRVSDAVTASPPAVTRVRVSVYGSGLGAATVAEACATAGEDPCLLGHFDAAIRRSRSERTSGDVMDLTRARTLPIKVHVAGPSGFWPTSIGDLVSVSTGTPFDVSDTGSCIVNEFTMPGQGLNALGAGLNALGAGLNALGAAGGLFLMGPGTQTGAPDIRLTSPSEAGALVDGLTANWSGMHDAAVLVVDDFSTAGGLRYLVPESLLQPSATFNEDDLRDAVGSDLSHGALVLHQVLAMVEATGWSLDENMSAANGSFRVYYRFVGEETRRDLVVAAVDTGGFNTDMIAGRIENALNTLLALGFDGDTMDVFGFSLDVRRVVVNMSFAIVPCAILEDYEAFVADPPATFEAYVAALADANGLQAFRDDLAELVVQPLGGLADPLNAQVVGDYQQCDGEYGEGPWWDESLSVWEVYVASPPVWIACWDFSESHEAVNYVASSGNFGLPFPMFPAAWPFVLGVSAQNAIGASESDGFDPARAGFANDGEVMAPGALFELGRSSATDPERVLAYAGTSFSAPVVSLFAAVDAMGGPYDCALPSYSELTDLHAGPAQPNANVGLGTAVGRCVDLN